MNLYNRMKLPPMTAHGAAMAIFGARGPTAAPPQFPAVQSMFARARAPRSVIDASKEMGYVLGQAGSGLNGLNGLRGFGALGSGNPSFPVVGPLSFAMSFSYEDFFSHKDTSPWNADLERLYNITYDGPPASLVSGARRGYAALEMEAAMSDYAGALFETYKNETEGLIDAIDALWPRDTFTGRRTAPIEEQRVNAMKALQGAMRKWNGAPAKLAKYNADMAKVGTGASGSSVGVNTTGVSTNTGTYTQLPGVNNNDYMLQLMLIKQQQDAQTKREADMLAQQQALLAQSKGASTAGGTGGASGMPSWVVPAAVGVGLVGVAVVLLGRKRK